MAAQPRGERLGLGAEQCSARLGGRRQAVRLLGEHHRRLGLTAGEVRGLGGERPRTGGALLVEGGPALLVREGPGGHRERQQQAEGGAQGLPQPYVPPLQGPQAALLPQAGP
ncbi:hypothetical protein LUX05_04140 [Streptomyces somaliensis]|nr:hypothetical protein [Streptomyces somaliensis]